jgi:hypothetical protein
MSINLYNDMINVSCQHIAVVATEMTNKHVQSKNKYDYFGRWLGLSQPLHNQC